MSDTKGIRAGRAFVELGVDDKIAKGLRAAEKRLKAFGAGVGSLGTQLAALGASLITSLLGAAKLFSDAGDALDKLSDRTGVSVEALSELGFAAEQSGADLETLEAGLRKMQRSIVDAARGSQTAVDALGALGLTVEDLVKLTPERQFKLIADRLSQISDPTARAALAMELLGKSGTRLLPLLKDGAKGIEELQQQARELGLTVSTQTAKDAALLNDTLNILWRVLKQTAFSIGAALGPTLVELANTVTHVVVRVTEWINQNRALIVIALQVAAAVTAVGAGLVVVGALISGLGTVFGGLAAVVAGIGPAFGVITAAIGALLSPIGLAIAAVVGLGTAIVTYTGAAGAAVNWLGEQFARLEKFLGQVVGGISDALAAGDVLLAAKVLWAGLKIAWETGIAPLRSAWNDFRFALQSVAVEAFAGIKAAWIDVSTWMWKNFPETTKFIATTWANLTGNLRNVWARFQNWLSDRWLEIMGLFDQTLDVSAAQAIGQQDLNDQLAQIETQRVADVAEAERKAGLTTAQHEQERAAALAKVVQEKADALAKLESEHSDRVQSAQAELNQAKADLEAARTAAAQKRAEFEGAGPPRRGPTDFQDQFAELGNLVAAKVSVIGTFNPLAVRGLGGEAVAERTARATEETAKHTKKLAEAATAGRLTFA